MAFKHAQGLFEIMKHTFDLLALERKTVDFAVKKRTVELNLDSFTNTLEQTNEFLVYKDDQAVKIYDRTCDHNGGQLFAKDGIARCPLHGWHLNPATGEYLDVQCSKKPLLTIQQPELDSPLVSVDTTESRRVLLGFDKKYKTQIEFINHACLLFSIDGIIKFATDPWVIGPAFCNGWWLSKKSPEDVFAKLNSCDFIFISHNHPDHLHPESLSYLRKDMPILTAPFPSGSTVNYLRSLGFQNIVTCGFTEYLICTERQIALSILKSGDFRDDSGLLIQIGEFSALLTVDSNFLDFGRLPEKINLLCSSFAGGASGFPLCFELYSEEEKTRIVQRNRSAIQATNRQSIQRCNPDHFMPYAGFFTEKAPRDSYVKKMNKKNSVADYHTLCKNLNVNLLNVDLENNFIFLGATLAGKIKIEVPPLAEADVQSYLEHVQADVSPIRYQDIEQYFEQSGFYHPLILEITPCDDDFKPVLPSVTIEFDTNSKPHILARANSARKQAEIAGKNYLHIKVRQNELKRVCAHGIPWEDLSIGFQCRIFRSPDIYNSEFWFHFTNTYIGDMVTKQICITKSESCGKIHRYRSPD